MSLATACAADLANNRASLSNIESNLNPLASLHPPDIESVEIVKDVSITLRQ